MERLILAAAIGSGGAAGALLRGLVSDYLKARTDDDLFWLGTLVVNLTGCFLIGFFSLVSARSTETSPLLWKFLITGFLGALTTFSTFALDLCLLLRDSRPATALLVAGSNLIPGVLLVFAGMKVAEILNTTSP